jgi:hypothetical protein
MSDVTIGQVPPPTAFYPSPFLDIASTKTPNNIKDMFGLAEYYYSQNKIVHAALIKKAAYPVTSIIYNHQNDSVIDTWKFILEDKLNFPELLEELNLNYYVYGNCFISIFQPIAKYTKCLACDAEFKFEQGNTYRIKNNKLVLRECPHCKATDPDVEFNDRLVTDLNQVRVQTWDPNRMGIKYNKLTGESRYTYDIPAKERDEIRNLTMPLKELAKIHQMYINAALSEDQVIVFKEGTIFHFKAPSIAGIDPGWGYPILLSGVKDLYQQQVLKKANESIMTGYMTPFRYLYPSGSNIAGTDVPWQGINLNQWKSHLVNELTKWRQDPNYISLLPFPAGQGTFGGDGKMLSTFTEVDIMDKNILAGLGIPFEVIFGGMQWSSTNISMRFLENEFLNIRKQNLKILKFVIKRVCSIFRKEEIGVSFTEFRMGDNEAKRQALVGLYQQQLIAPSTLLSEFGIDFEKEMEKRISDMSKIEQVQKKEAMSQATLQNEISKLQMEANASLGIGPDGQPLQQVDPDGKPMGGAQGDSQDKPAPKKSGDSGKNPNTKIEHSAENGKTKIEISQGAGKAPKKK